MPSLTSPILDRDEYSFKDMWEQAQIRFQERTAKSLKSSAGKSLEDVLKGLEERYPEETVFESQVQSKSQVKDVVRNILNCINILGGIVAQGASMAFGGAANICYSAVSFLIEMHARIDRMYEGLALLFEEISTFLKTFKIYKRIEKFAEVDPELKATTGRLMISFVDICALSIKLLGGSKWKKFKTVLKVALLDDDSGIRAELEKFKGLVSQSSRISDAVTLEAVMVSHHEVVDLLMDASQKSGQQLLYLEGINSGVNVLKADLNEHRNQKLRTEQIQDMMKKLAINQETAKASMRYLDDIRINPAPQSGLWIKGLPEYQRWIDIASQDQKPLLLLCGGEKSGKSFLIGGILDELEFQFREGRQSDFRASIAYYGFSKLDKKMEKSNLIKNPQLPVTAFKSMAVRYAEQSISYSKDMASFWATKKANDCAAMSARELWDTLQLSAPRNDTAHYLIFDGLEMLDESDAAYLMEVLLSIKHPRVRVLIAAPSSILETSLARTEEQLVNDAIPRIDIESQNSSDIKLFIDRYLLQNGELFGLDTETLKLKSWLRENLPGLVKGNFHRLQIALDQFTDDYKRGHTTDDITRHLETADLSQDPNIAAKQLVSRLNKSLSSQEIDQLNEILLWTLYGCKYLDVEELRAALFLRFQFDPAQPLVAQITGKGKYEPLFTVEQDKGIVVRENVLVFLASNARETRTKAGGLERGKPKISMTIKITDADIETVQRFLWDLAERASFDKFKFDNVEAKVDTQKRIYVHEIDACLTLIQRCVDLLLAEPDVSSSAIVPYALLYLPAHLERLRDFANQGELDALEMHSVVDKLVNLFSDTECIEKHWTSGANLIGWGLPIFSWWLYKNDIIQMLRPRDRRWLERLDTRKNPKTSCLSDIAVMVGDHWLRRRDDINFVDHARWIYDYTCQLANATKSTDGEGEGSEPVREYPTGTSVVDQLITFMDAESIQRAAQWVEDDLKIKTKDSVWFERLGSTFLACEFYDDAITAFIQAKELSDVHLNSAEGLAAAHAAKGDLELAIKEISVVVEALKARSGSDAALEELRIALPRILRLQAGWHLRTQPPDRKTAITLYREVLDLDATDYFSQWRLFKAFTDAGSYSDAIELLRGFNGRPATTPGMADQLAAMLYNYSYDFDDVSTLDSFDQFVSLTASDAMAASVLTNLKACIDLAHKDNNTHALIRLLFLQGVALFEYNIDKGDQTEAIASWKRCCFLGFKAPAALDTPSEVSISVTLAVKRLSNYYHSAFSKGGTGESVYISELQELQKEAQKNYWTALPARFALAACYLFANAREKAQDLLLNSMKTGLDLLSDDDPDNDYQGYMAIAEAALHAGDDLNAISALSLLVPDDVDDAGRQTVATATTSASDDTNPQPQAEEVALPGPEVRTGKMNNYCDGGCGVTWAYADDIWFCKICSDVQFDGQCLNKLHEGTLKRVICNKSHEWLHVPPFSEEEYLKVGKGRVRIGGEMVDGKREGGDIVTIAEWLDALRNQWKIPKEVEEAVDNA